jgi:deoxyribodipyrimidine photolyase-related protein
MSEAVTLVLGNQLFPEHAWPASLPRRFYLAEDFELCTYFKHHKQKLMLFLVSMRRYAEELRKAGAEVHYESLPESKGAPYEVKLGQFLESSKVQHVHVFEIEDRFFEKRLLEFLGAKGVGVTVHPSPLFVTPRETFQGYLKERKPFMKTFYEAQRKRLGILVDKRGQPVGGKWSFDQENRKRLPKSLHPPSIPKFAPLPVVGEVANMVEERFPDHPGSTEGFWLPTSRSEALVWLQDFLDKRLEHFGEYEDALTTQHDFVFHSLLTPVLNMGLITPAEVIERTLAHAERTHTPLNSLEGFIRQIIGWREFIRGIYRNYGERQEAANFWKHERKLSRDWYDGTTGIAPLDHVIRKVQRLGYAHHIERLMIAGNIMVLAEIAPTEAHRWFMEMFVDSSDWVMGPNVYGMALFSDGGIFATKPYLCGSNYLLKMGDFPKGDWCEVLDGLYWRFIAKHEKFFMGNPRLSVMPRALAKMEAGRRARLFARAEEFLARPSA